MRPVNILVVDDHPDNVLALRAILSRADYSIVSASSGSGALKEVLKHDFAVILLDVLMPDMDGFETARLIRERDASRHVPIIFLTAEQSEVSSVYRGYRVGAVDYLVKPIDPDIVRAKVSVFVDLYLKTVRIREQEVRLREAERKLGEEALRASEDLYQAAFDRAPVGIAHADLAGSWLRMNRRFLEIVGSRPNPLALAETRSLIAREIDELREEKQYPRTDGAIVWVSEVLSLVRDHGGEPKHFILVVEDISERKASEERDRFLAASSRLLMSSFDHRSTLAEVARLAVTTVAEGCIIHVPEGETETELLEIAHTNPERVSDLERIWRESPLDPSLLMVTLESRGRSLGQIGFMGGHTDRAMAEDFAHRAAFAIDNARLYREAQDAVGARDEFLSIASHELRTPLTPLQLLFQRLLGEENQRRSQEQFQEVLQRGERQVQRLTSLVDKLLDVSRIAAGKMFLQRDHCDLVEITIEVLARLADELARADCQVDLITTDPVLGCWDELRLEQVITNLVSNALKYGAGHPISIRVHREGAQAVFVIRDQGMGIEADKLTKIFGRFERAVSSRSYGGLGLGLYIARQLVDAHGGQISVESRPGAGAAFTFRLPVETQSIEA